jgi:hypothetical protein
VSHCQVQVLTSARLRRDQVSVVKVSGSRADADDQTNVHVQWLKVRSGMA